MRKETIGITVASLAISMLVLTLPPRVELTVRIWSWAVVAGGYFASLWAFQDKHPIGMLVHMVAVLMVIVSLMAVSVPAKKWQKLYWAVMWLAVITGTIALMDAGVYGKVLFYAIGPGPYLLIGAVVGGSLIVAIFLWFGMGTAKAVGDAIKRDTWGPNVR